MTSDLGEVLSLLHGKGSPSEPDLERAIQGLTSYPPYIVDRHLVRMLGHQSERVRTAAAGALTEHGEGSLVATTRSAIETWDRGGLLRDLKALNAESQARLFAVCSEANSNYYCWNLMRFMSKTNAKDAQDFVEHLCGSDAVPWSEIVEELKRRGRHQLATPIIERMESPRPGSLVPPASVPALVYAFLCKMAPERRLFTVIRGAAEAGLDEVLCALHDEAVILDSHADSGREERLLLLARPWFSPRLRAFALYALGSTNTKVVEAGEGYLKAHNEGALAVVMAEISTKDASPFHVRQTLDSHDLLPPLKRKLKGVPN